MAKKGTKMNYEKEEDILDLSRGKKAKASIEVGDFIIDIDSNGFVSGIEVLNASENLHTSKEILSNIKKASMHVAYKHNFVMVTLFLQFKDTEKEVTIPLTVNLGHESVKTEKMTFATA